MRSCMLGIGASLSNSIHHSLALSVLVDPFTRPGSGLGLHILRSLLEVVVEDCHQASCQVPDLRPARQTQDILNVGVIPIPAFIGNRLNRRFKLQVSPSLRQGSQNGANELACSPGARARATTAILNCSSVLSKDSSSDFIRANHSTPFETQSVELLF